MFNDRDLWPSGINRTALREIKLLQELHHPNIIGVSRRLCFLLTQSRVDLDHKDCMPHVSELRIWWFVFAAAWRLWTQVEHQPCVWFHGNRSGGQPCFHIRSIFVYSLSLYKICLWKTPSSFKHLFRHIKTVTLLLFSWHLVIQTFLRKLTHEFPRNIIFVASEMTSQFLNTITTSLTLVRKPPLWFAYINYTYFSKLLQINTFCTSSGSLIYLCN